MKRHHISSLGEADIYFVEQGAVAFFDSWFPKEKWDDSPKVFKRHYFAAEDEHMGWFIPSLVHLGTHLSVKHYTDRATHIMTHPNLTKLLEDLQ